MPKIVFDILMLCTVILLLFDYTVKQENNRARATERNRLWYPISFKTRKP